MLSLFSCCNARIDSVLKSNDNFVEITNSKRQHNHQPPSERLTDWLRRRLRQFLRELSHPSLLIVGRWRSEQQIFRIVPVEVNCMWTQLRFFTSSFGELRLSRKLRCQLFLKPWAKVELKFWAKHRALKNIGRTVVNKNTYITCQRLALCTILPLHGAITLVSRCSLWNFEWQPKNKQWVIFCSKMFVWGLLTHCTSPSHERSKAGRTTHGSAFKNRFETRQQRGPPQKSTKMTSMVIDLY